MGPCGVQGCAIQAVELFCFDTVSDGMIEQSAEMIVFKSKTTGDRDGFDLVLDQADTGRVIFDSAAGQVTVNLADLTDDAPRQQIDFGGVDIQVIVERYPLEVSTLALTLSESVSPPLGELT